jgi:hypothetical protein
MKKSRDLGEGNQSDELHDWDERRYERWKDYANALLVTFSILFAGVAIGARSQPWSFLSGLCGIVGIVCVALWHSNDPPWYFGDRCWLKFIRKRPVLLVIATACLALQSCSLVVMLW